MPSCELCSKKYNRSNKVSFSNKHNRVFQQPNLQKCRVQLPGGQVKSLKICTSCIKAFKFKRAKTGASKQQAAV